jgi:hypothetical protein
MRITAEHLLLGVLWLAVTLFVIAHDAEAVRMSGNAAQANFLVGVLTQLLGQSHLPLSCWLAARAMLLIRRSSWRPPWPRKAGLTR